MMPPTLQPSTIILTINPTLLPFYYFHFTSERHVMQSLSNCFSSLAWEVLRSECGSTSDHLQACPPSTPPRLNLVAAWPHVPSEILYSLGSGLVFRLKNELCGNCEFKPILDSHLLNCLFSLPYKCSHNLNASAIVDYCIYTMPDVIWFELCPHTAGAKWRPQLRKFGLKYLCIFI